MAATMATTMAIEPPSSRTSRRAAGRSAHGRSGRWSTRWPYLLRPYLLWLYLLWPYLLWPYLLWLYLLWPFLVVRRHAYTVHVRCIHQHACLFTLPRVVCAARRAATTATWAPRPPPSSRRAAAASRPWAEGASCSTACGGACMSSATRSGWGATRAARLAAACQITRRRPLPTMAVRWLLTHSLTHSLTHLHLLHTHYSPQAADLVRLGLPGHAVTFSAEGY